MAKNDKNLVQKIFLPKRNTKLAKVAWALSWGSTIVGIIDYVLAKRAGTL